MSKVLDNKKCLNFLKFIGYPSEYNLDSYIDLLVDKLHSKDFPHEIGIFLGYPLKDVVGFMGYGNYKFCKTRYWKVYGDESISDNVYNKFLYHRSKMKSIVECKSLVYNKFLYHRSKMKSIVECKSLSQLKSVI